MHDLVLPVAVVDEVVSVTFAAVLCFVLVLSRRQCASANVVNADDGQTYKSESKESNHQSSIGMEKPCMHACMHAVGSTQLIRPCVAQAAVLTAI